MQRQNLKKHVKTSPDYADFSSFTRTRSIWRIPQAPVKTSNDYCIYSYKEKFWHNLKHKFLAAKTPEAYKQAYQDIQLFIERSGQDKKFNVLKCKIFLAGYPKPEEYKLGKPQKIQSLT